MTGHAGYTWTPVADDTVRPSHLARLFDVPPRARRSPAFLRMDAERARLAADGIASAKLYDLALERAARRGSP